MSDESRMLPKREAMESLLAQGDVLLQLDPRVRGVQVPSTFKEQPMLVLRVGLDMPIPIPDLVIDDEGLSATLSFDRTPHEVVVPWPAVFGMATEQGQGLLWTADVPLEIVDQLLESTGGFTGHEQDVFEPEPPEERPRFGVLDGGRDEPGPPREPGPGSGPPSLRVVK